MVTRNERDFEDHNLRPGGLFGGFLLFCFFDGVFLLFFKAFRPFGTSFPRALLLASIVISLHPIHIYGGNIPGAAYAICLNLGSRQNQATSTTIPCSVGHCDDGF